MSIRRVPGFRSTEFWMVLLYLAALVTRKWTGLDAEELYAAAGVVGLYTGGRSFVKATAAAPKETTP